MGEATITHLQLQPLKGGGSLPLREARMTLAGMETVDGKIKDHSLFVVDANARDVQGYHHFFTQRKQTNPAKNLFVEGTPRLALVKPEMRNGNLVFTFDGRDPIVDPGEERDNPKHVIPVQVWEYRGRAVEVPQLSRWLSDHLQREVKVARTSGPWNRQARQNFVPNKNPLRAQDGYPVHPVTQEDAAAIFGALGVSSDPNRFRYQMLLQGLPFRGIHDYQAAQVNGTAVIQAKPSERCEVTGIDQARGEFSSIKPLSGINKLGAARWVRPDTSKKVHIVGENWLPQGETIIRVGDRVNFTQRRTTPLTFEDKSPTNP